MKIFSKIYSYFYWKALQRRHKRNRRILVRNHKKVSQLDAVHKEKICAILRGKNIRIDI